MKEILLFIGLILFISCSSEHNSNVGKTDITKWQDDKRSAISITYDDGIINQFTVAKPIMDSLGMPGTFYIITGKIDGAQKGKFIGRSQADIIKETASIKTNEDNFFERASLIAFTGTTEGIDYHSRAGSLFESGKVKEAYELIDEGYRKIRNGTIRDLDEIIFHDNPEDTTTWTDLKLYAEQGHEIASHTVTHARLAVLDEVNMLYELEQSKKDIQQFLGEEYTFTAECPYGTENERVMDYAHEIYPALRNRMPEPYMDELNRSSRRQPGESNKEYVQWQRGPLTDISMEQMKSWVDTCLAHENIWLVLVFHGVDGIGWEPKTGEDLRQYFTYINDRNDHIWVATFANVTKYIRTRKNTIIDSQFKGKEIVINLSSKLDPEVYNVPITLKTYIPDNWNSVSVSGLKKEIDINKDNLGSYITFPVAISEKEIIIRKA